MKKNDSANPIENVKILCKILCRVSGSKIFRSVSGSGSTFRVRVPGSKIFKSVSGSGLTFRVSGSGLTFRVRVPGSGSDPKPLDAGNVY